ncbi:hypothetical protein LDENG_00000130 [Lucifuga dentata]|nr:hypothetical protein LDENG_00000130 [Lucifuga dentata]
MSNFLYFILPALGGYTLTSLYLLKNPHILHKRKRTTFNCTHISHRGGSGERIESTMEAFTNAVEQGTEMLELDCHLTQDGHVVVSHDENLLRETGHDVTISSLRLQDLPLYKERLEVTFYIGHYSTGADRKFALLEDLFRKFPKIPISIEIKENNRLLTEKVSDLVRRYNREDITVWASVNSRIMKNCLRMNSSMPYSFTASRGVLLLLLFYSGLLPFVPLGESLLQFYLPCIINRTFIPEEHFLRNRLVVSLLEKVAMRKSLFRHLAARGIQVHLFVCNNNEDIKAAFDVGATGITRLSVTLARCGDFDEPIGTVSDMVKLTKAKTFQAYLDSCHRRYSCVHCRAHLANHDELISKSFQGSQGRAYLFNSVVNVGCGPAEERLLLTGLHAVADIYCENCHTTLGWKYEQAFELSQKYKEGKYIIELSHMIKDNGWD